MDFKLEFVVSTILAVFISYANGKYVEDKLDTSEPWEFITRFCFVSGQGMTYHFEYPITYGPMNLLLYWDKPGLWESVYQTDLTCQEKEDLLDRQYRQIIELTDRDFAGCQINGTDWVCEYSLNVQTSRNRWWYIALSRCGATDPVGLSVRYWIHMTNGDEGDFLHRELSADEFYIWPIDLAFFLAYVIISILTGICAYFLSKRQLLHTTYKLYMASVFLWTFFLFIMVIGYGVYAHDGLESKLRGTKVAARVFEAISVLIFLAMLFLMATGYTITRGRLSNIQTMVLTVFFTVYTVMYCFVFVWEAVYFDPGLVLYRYESPPGYCLIALRLIGWIWFIIAVFMTLKSAPTKKTFYIPFFIFYTLWFWAGPIVVLVALFAMELHFREKTVVGVENLVALCGHVFFLILTRPTAANANFPYHVRTTQIGILSPPEGDSNGDQNMNNLRGANYMIDPVPDESPPQYYAHFYVSGYATPSAPHDTQYSTNNLYNNDSTKDSALPS